MGTSERDLRYVDLNGTELDYDDTWHAINSYFRDTSNALVAHQIHSFDDCLSTVIPKIIHDRENNPIVVKTDYSPETSEHNLEYQLEWKEVRLGQPVIQENSGVVKPLTPAAARMRNITYAANLYVDIDHQLKRRKDDGSWGEPEKQTLKNVLICRMPLMLGSKFCILADKSTETRAELGECRYDDLGYFIINGSEKVLISIEKIYENKVLVFENADANSQRYSDVCEVRSALDGRYQIAYNTKVRLLKDKASGIGRPIKCVFHNIKQGDVPIFILFRALGIDSDKRICQLIVYDLNDTDMIELLKPSLEEGTIAYTQVAAFEWISKQLNISNINSSQLSEEARYSYRMKMVKSSLLRFLLPHVGESFEKKAYFLGYMVNRMLSCVLGRRNYDDRDHFGNKKIETPGSLVASLFAQNFSKKLVKTFEKEMRRELNNYQDGIANLKIDNHIKSTQLDTGMKWSFSTGTWGLKSSIGNNKVGVAQQLTRINAKASLSSKRRVVTNIEKTGKGMTGPRKLHCTHWGVICPAETPDGEGIGITKNLAMMACITNHEEPETVVEHLEELGLEYLDSVDIQDICKGTKVFINGEWIGLHFDPPRLVENLRALRRDGIVHIHTSIMWNIAYKEIFISTDAGRLVRPLYIVEDNKLLITSKMLKGLEDSEIRWQDLLGIGPQTFKGLSSSVVEYMDVNEAETAMVAMTPDDLVVNKKENPVYLEYTHCELHPSTILGVVISEVPFPDHNQAPRVIFFGQMGKQATGVYATNYSSRMDTVAHVLHYPQRPLVSTRMSEIIGKELPIGQNAIVAVMCYSGFNQEDSVIINGGSLDRGFCTTTCYKTYRDEEKKNQAELQEEKFEKPGANTIQAAINYDAIGDDGLPIIGKKVQEHDVIIGKTVPLKVTADGTKQKRDASFKLPNGDGGTIDAVKSNINGDGYKFVKGKIRKIRVPQIGDKMQSRHAQKGIVGMVFPPEDMPVTADGITPDIIINPHAFPSRMTIGQLLESIMGKVGCLKGFETDGTPFNGVNVDDICKVLGTPKEEGGCGFTEKITEDGPRGYGNEVMYNGMTGEQLECKIFLGNVFYMRSKHMVADKYHSRSTGAIQLLTRQPPEGRARGGSSKIGEMERDALIAHGLANLQREKYMDASDLFEVNVNRQTGLLAIGNPDTGTLRDDMQDIKKLHLPYSYKLLHQELMAMGIGLRHVVA